MNDRNPRPAARLDALPAGGRIAAGLARLAIALRQRSWRDAGALGLTPTQGQIVEWLASHRDPTLSELASGLGLRAATASVAVATLVDKGLVDKERPASDRRRLALRLTPAGRRLAPAAADFPSHLAAAAERLGPEDQAHFLRLLVRMIRELQEAGEIETARVCATCDYFRPNAHADPARPHHCAFVDAPFGDLELRVDCADHVPAEARRAAAIWHRFAGPSS